MIFLPFILNSCEKTLPDVSGNEIPAWLKTRISLDEQTIQDNPKYMASWGAWMRYLFLIHLMAFTFTVAGQDTLKSEKMIGWDNHFKSKYGKYIGIQYPDFVVTFSDKSSFSNKNLENKVVFINFWFSHCPPCIGEIEGLNEMFNSLKDKSDFLFISFTFDSDDLIKASVEKYDIQYKVIHLGKQNSPG